MATEKEYTGRTRSLKILFTIVESPFVYTIKRLAEKYDVDVSTIKMDFEAFSVSAEDDIVHAYDLDKKGIRHFRISRIPKLEITPTDWTNETKHYLQQTDCFRIHDNKQVNVHLRIKVGAFNQLLEQFPMARAYLKPTNEASDTYDFQCKVNHKFSGLSNFIMGNYRNIEAIYEPDALIEHIEAEAKKILAKRF